MDYISSTLLKTYTRSQRAELRKNASNLSMLYGTESKSRVNSFLIARDRLIMLCLGIPCFLSIQDYTPEEFQEIMSVNVNGAFYTVQAAARIKSSKVSAISPSQHLSARHSWIRPNDRLQYVPVFSVSSVYNSREISIPCFTFLLTSLSIMRRKLGSYSLPNRLQWNGGISAESTVYHRAILKQKLWNTRLRICSISGSIKFQPADLLRLMSLKG